MSVLCERTSIKKRENERTKVMFKLLHLVEYAGFMSQTRRGTVWKWQLLSLKSKENNKYYHS